MVKDWPLGIGREVSSGMESKELRVCELVWKTIYPLFLQLVNCHLSFPYTVVMGQAPGCSDLQRLSFLHPSAAAAGVLKRSFRSGAFIRRPPNLV